MRYIFRIVFFCGILLFSSFSFDISSAQTRSRIFLKTPPPQVQVGERLSIEVRIQSTLQSINAVSGVLSFPENLISVSSVSRDRSIINLWTQEPKVRRNRIDFEGIILNPGFQGASGEIFRITFEAKREGVVNLNLIEGAVLANDGRGTNVLATLGNASFRIVSLKTFSEYQTIAEEFLEDDTKLSELPVKTALPVITDYSPIVDPTGTAYLKGKGEPNALTKIVFKDISLKSVGERFLAMLQTKKKTLDEVLVRNDNTGAFEYVSTSNLVAGVYNATPFLVDIETSIEKPGLGVQLFVSDSKIVRALIVMINVLGLLIPIVGLCVIIYFIPWYSWRRMRVLKKKLGFEEERIELSGHQLERQDKILDKTVDTFVDPNRL